jgi:hypothetical protein
MRRESGARPTWWIENEGEEEGGEPTATRGTLGASVAMQWSPAGVATSMPARVGMAFGSLRGDTCTATVSVPPAGRLSRAHVTVRLLWPHSSPLPAVTATAGELAFC